MKIKKIISLLILSLTLGLNSINGEQGDLFVKKRASINPVEIILKSSEDSYVSGGINADLNFGKASPIKVRKHTTSAKNDEQGYIKFAIPSGTTSVSKAIFDIGLQAPAATGKVNNFTLYTTESDWSEGTGKAAGLTVDYAVNPTFITYNNVPDIFPANQNPVDFSTPIGAVRDDRFTCDVTVLVNNYIKTFADNTVSNYISFCISSTIDAKAEEFSFQSNNYAGKEPKLTITLGDFDSNEESETVYPGVTYETERILNNAKVPVNMFSLEVAGNTSLSFYTGTPDDKLPLEIGKQASVLEMAEAAEANGKRVLGGINGDFFNSSNLSAIQPRGLVIRDGVEYHSEYNGCTFFGVLDNGSPIIGGRDEYYANKGHIDMAVGGDIGFLVKDGIACETNEEAGEHDEGNVNPRTAIGIKPDNSVVMVVCDGRTADSNGMVLTDLANYMVGKGCEIAINLDGGWSSTMVRKDFSKDSFEVCNYPSNNGQLRPIGDSILIIDTNEEAKANKEMVAGFVYRYMHMEDIDISDNGTGACMGEQGYYAVAKNALLGLEDRYEGAIDILTTDEDFLDAYNRLQAWAIANNETFNQNGFNQNNILMIMTHGKGNGVVSEIICISAIILVLCFSFLILIVSRKKKINK